MASPTILMGLGMPHFLAGKVGVHIEAVTCQGAAVGSARQLPGQQGLYYVNASNSGSGVALPLVGGDGPSGGIQRGDWIVVSNIQGATIAVYANTNGAGSACVLYGRGVSTAGSTGVSVTTGNTAYFQAITASAWIFGGASA